MAAVDAGENAAVEWGSEPAAGLLDEDVVDCAFSDLVARVQEEDVCEARGTGDGVGAVVKFAPRGLVEEEAIGGVGAMRCDTDGGQSFVRGSIWQGIDLEC